ILADHVQIGRPERGELALDIRIAERADVIDQRIEPHIDDMLRVARHRHAPAEAGARDRQIVEPRFDKADDLVAGRARRDGIVRMESSLLMLRSCVSSRQAGEMRSQNACGAMPAARADCSTFWPCSSLPVRNLTRYPSSRINRASASHATVV